MNNIKWSKKEKSIARAAFEKAYEKECDQIIEKLKVKSLKLLGSSLFHVGKSKSSLPAMR